MRPGRRQPKISAKALELQRQKEESQRRKEEKAREKERQDASNKRKSSSNNNNKHKSRKKSNTITTSTSTPPPHEAPVVTTTSVAPNGVTTDQENGSNTNPPALDVSVSSGQWEKTPSAEKLIIARFLGTSVHELDNKYSKHATAATPPSGSLSNGNSEQHAAVPWFSQKAKKGSSSEAEGDTVVEDELIIERDSLVQLKCARGKSESIEFYRVLAFFSKYYNKWFPAQEDKFAWESEASKRGKVRVLARLLKKTGSSYRDVDLEAGGDWSPSQVYCIKSFGDILKLEGGLADI